MFFENTGEPAVSRSYIRAAMYRPEQVAGEPVLLTDDEKYVLSQETLREQHSIQGTQPIRRLQTKLAE